MNTTTRKTTTTETRYEFGPEEVLKALIAANLIPANKAISNEAIFVRVPGGGDYSNMNLELEMSPLVVVMHEEKVETS